MEIEQILSHVDHTLLSPSATWAEIKALLDDGVRYGVASCCIPPSFVKRAVEYVGSDLRICTVIGFPNGYSETEAKVCEIERAYADGCAEFDAVVNIGDVKDGRFDRVLSEIKELKKACGGRILKIIVEASLLTEEEKIRMCGVVSEGGADFIKTSTGFSKGGATFEDVALFRKHVAPGVRVKAAGGISSLEDAEKFLALGADRLGTSRIVRIVKETAR